MIEAMARLNPHERPHLIIIKEENIQYLSVKPTAGDDSYMMTFQFSGGTVTLFFNSKAELNVIFKQITGREFDYGVQEG